MKLNVYHKEHRKFPSIQEFSAYANLSYDITVKLYKRWINQHKIVRKGNGFDFFVEDPNKLFYDAAEQKPDNLKIPQKEQEKEKDKPGVLFKVVRVLVGLIGILLVFCSIHFTLEFNRLSMKWFWAFCLSFSIVTFMAIAFTIADFMKKPLMKIIVIGLWALGFAYSVFTAVSGQYNDFRKYVSSDKSGIIEKQKEIINEQIEIQIKKQKELLHWREQETEYSMEPSLKVLNPGTWRNIQNGVKQLEETEKKIEELGHQMLEVINDMVEEIIGGSSDDIAKQLGDAFAAWLLCHL